MNYWLKYILIILFILGPWTAVVQAKDKIFSSYRKKGNLFVNFAIKPKKRKLISKKMKSGLTQRVYYTIKLINKQNKKVICTSIKYCKITWDLWDEIFLVKCFSPQLITKIKIKNLKKILKKIFTVKDMQLCSVTNLKAEGSYYYELDLVLNPISKKLISKIKLWIRQKDQYNQFTNYLGSFFSNFVNKNIGKNDYSFSLKSSIFSRKGISEK
ncbi:MAG: hypothetical protein ACQES9_11845 [Myxococcota bacterium]